MPILSKCFSIDYSLHDLTTQLLYCMYTDWAQYCDYLSTCCSKTKTMLLEVALTILTRNDLQAQNTYLLKYLSL